MNETSRQVDKRFSLIIRIIAILVVGGTFIRVISLATSPDGYLTIKTNITDPSPFVSEPKPSERLALKKGTPYRLIDEPVYFDLKPPALFDTVTVSLSYLNRGQQVVEIGALANRLDGQYDLRPAENRLIDSLTWKRLSSGSLNLLQRKVIYDSLDSFLANPPEASRVATYRSTLNWPYHPVTYVPLTGTKTREISLRGHHRILTYTGGESLSFNFSIQDMNRQEGADPVTISVYREGEKDVVARTVLADDGNTTDNQKSSGLRTVAVSLSDPQPGLYRLEFTAPGDVFIRKLTTRQNKFVFLNRLYLGDHVGYSDRISPITVFVAGRMVVAKTAHDEGLQTLQVDGRDLVIRELNTRYFSRLGEGQGPFSITSTKRDILIETDSVIALEPDDFFNPLPLELDWYLTSNELAAENVDFIVTDYESPSMADQWTVAEATFEVSQLATTENGAFRFAISAPGIGLTQNDLRLGSLTFILYRQPTGWLAGLRTLLTDLGWQFTDRETAVILSDGQSYSENVE